MLELLQQYLTQRQWQFSEISKGNTLFFGVRTEHGGLQCTATIIEDRQLINFHTSCATVPADKRPLVLDFINTLNFNLFIGHFEIEPRGGDVRCRTTVSYQYLKPGIEVIEEIIMSNIITASRSLPGLSGVLYGGLTTDQAMELVKKQEDAAVTG